MSSETPDDHQYYEGFADPTADLIIEVTDKARFRVDSHTLRAQSAFFSSMPEYSAELAGPSEKLIYLEADSKHLAGLLSLLNGEPGLKGQFERQHLQEIVSLGNRYRFHGLPKSIEFSNSIKRTYSIFRSAARYDQRDLAKEAVSHLDDYQFRRFAAFKPLMAEFSHNYKAALYRAMLGFGPRTWDSHRISERFYVDDEDVGFSGMKSAAKKLSKSLKGSNAYM